MSNMNPENLTPADVDSPTRSHSTQTKSISRNVKGNTTTEKTVSDTSTINGSATISVHVETTVVSTVTVTPHGSSSEALIPPPSSPPPYPSLPSSSSSTAVLTPKSSFTSSSFPLPPSTSSTPMDPPGLSTPTQDAARREGRTLRRTRTTIPQYPRSHSPPLEENGRIDEDKITKLFREINSNRLSDPEYWIEMRKSMAKFLAEGQRSMEARQGGLARKNAFSDGYH
ncbi:hypothetical protein F4678DRAFT_464565 [Xylaria arbuscula]|nr:hypothetical protein F4678DRAFT_464565 [Xylaria arbuscula]